MLIDPYFIEEDSKVVISRQQASDFAKLIADDFNPLHDINAKRFCVPGDLLFAMLLAKYGIAEHMRFTFSGMVTDEVTLNLPPLAPHMPIIADNDKEYLSVQRDGSNSDNSALIDNLTRNYVAFSGQTFPHVLVPLLQQENVMINPDRPMVMYQSMLIDLERLNVTDVELQLDREKTTVEVAGKRANVTLAFNLSSGDEIVGRGEKHMLVSGLKPYDQEAIDAITKKYAQWKTDFNN